MEIFEPRDRSVIGRGRSLQKEHEVDIPLTRGLDVPGRIKTVHGCVKNYLQHLPGRCCIFPDPVIGPDKIGQIQFLHELTQQTHLVIRCDESFQIQRKYQLISALGKGIILTVFLFHRSYNYTMRARSFGTWFLCFTGLSRAFYKSPPKKKSRPEAVARLLPEGRSDRSRVGWVKDRGQRPMILGI